LKNLKKFVTVWEENYHEEFIRWKTSLIGKE